jgi:HPt (histidine-containing phosphotransfer) domain-containing protein
MQIVIPKELLRKYIERRQLDAQELDAAVEAGQLKEFRRIGHQLRGNAPTYGFPLLAELGQKMEDAADQNNAAAARDCVFALRKWVAQQGNPL